MTRRGFLQLAAVASLALLSACTSGGQPQSAASTSTPSSATAVGASTRPGSEQAASWDDTLAAGKREGTVAVIGPVGDEVHNALTSAFQSQYGIQVDYQALQGAEIGPRVSPERQAGKYLWDVYIGGVPQVLTSLFPIAALDPIEPALLLPDVKDPAKWRNGGMEFVDAARRLMVMAPTTQGVLYVNPKLVEPTSLKSYKDLLDPRWKGKLLVQDPRIVGPGQSTFTFFFLHPELGPNFIRALAAQQPTILRDYRQEADQVAKGGSALLIGGNDFTVEPMTTAGLPILTIDPRQVHEGSPVSSGSSGLAVFNRAPHPNAGKIYVNWLLSQEGQTALSKALSYVSARVDVSTGLAAWKVPQPNFIKVYGEDALRTIDADVLPLVKELFGAS